MNRLRLFLVLVGFAALYRAIQRDEERRTQEAFAVLWAERRDSPQKEYEIGEALALLYGGE